MYKLFTPFIYILLFLIPLEADFLNIFSDIEKTIEPVKVEKELKSKELYLKYTKYPKTIYTNQRFSIELEARILTSKDKYDVIFTSYEDDKNIELLDLNITWIQKDENLYTTKITYKVKDENFKLPVIRISIQKATIIEHEEIEIVEDNEDDGIFEYQDINTTIKEDIIAYNEVGFIKIKPPVVHYNNIAINQKNFSNIIASDLKIKEVQSRQYNNSMLMVVCNIEASNSNLEEFYLNQFEEQGIKNFENNFPKQSMFYYVIVPNHIQTIQFNYYNPRSATFVNVELPIILEDDLVSTQTDLNPNDGNLLIYKIVATGILLIIMLLLFLKTYNKFLIILIIFMTYIFITLLLPNEKVFIKKDTNIYILPTKLSTIYKVTNNETKVEILQRQHGFIKILFSNKTIGWVKERDVK